jgi:hypothetical protein
MIRPADVLFHPLKHHLPTIAGFIQTGAQRSLTDSLKQLKTIGASQFDLYMGQLAAADIAVETVEQLKTIGLVTEQQYHEWTAGNNGYRTIFLSDGSEWTLRYLPQPAYVHIHPSRYALYTMRIKANAMKTVCCYLLLRGWQDPRPDIGVLNEIRTRHLGLSPVSLQNGNDEIMKVYGLLRAALAEV